MVVYWVAGAAITAVLEWCRINDFCAEGSPVETVRRRLPKRAGGPKRHDAVDWSEVSGALARIDAGQCWPSTKRAMRFTALTAARRVGHAAVGGLHRGARGGAGGIERTGPGW